MQKEGNLLQFVLEAAEFTLFNPLEASNLVPHLATLFYRKSKASFPETPRTLINPLRPNAENSKSLS